MKIISKINIHPFFYLFAIICITNGLFKDFIYIMFIILFHEIGHIIVSQLYKWNIKKIVVLPFGGITIFECLINTSLKQELLVTLAGPLFQTLLFAISDSKFTFYNYSLLLFNLIPIIPLDGSKLLNILLNKLFSFSNSQIINNIVSILLIIVLFILSNSLIELMIIILLTLKVIEMIKKRKFIFNKFLFERYLYTFKFKKTKIIINDQFNKMKRDYKHLFYIDKQYKTERELLRKKFDK